MLLLVANALWRAKLKIGYELGHANQTVLALMAVSGGIVHMVVRRSYFGDPRKRALWIGLVVFWVLLLYVSVFTPLFMLRRPYRIAAMKQKLWRGPFRIPQGTGGAALAPGHAPRARASRAATELGRRAWPN